MARTIGDAACLLGKTWGYDDGGVWVLDGCSAEFVVMRASEVTPQLADTQDTAPKEVAEDVMRDVPADEYQTTDAPTVVAANADTPADQVESDEAFAAQEYTEEKWGVLDPGKGFLLGKNELGEASISAYALVRYLNQLPAEQTFIDHLGRERPVDTREDIYSHRVLVWLRGWMGVPEFQYTIAWWTVNTTDQDALFGNLSYTFDRKFTLAAGIFGNPGSRSMLGSHPYWLGHDRVMADEFFRPFFSQGIWATGEVLPGLWYNASMGNSSSILGVKAANLDRKFTYGGSLWWMPTTKEFGPRGGYGDWEWHEQLATRFGVSAVFSPEQRFADVDAEPGNTALRLADSVNLFETGSLAPGVTVTSADYQVMSVDAGMKYKGIFLQTEFYWRKLDNFQATGALPTDSIEDYGFYVQAAFFPIPKKLELYTSTSQIYADKSLGFRDSSDYILGANWYPFNTRNHRLNLQYIDVTRSPVSSTFGYYTGGQDGSTWSLGASIFF